MRPRVATTEQDLREGVERRVGSPRFWLLALLPVLLLAALVAMLMRFGPAGIFTGDAPPVERLAFQRVELTPGGFVADVFNDGPEPTTIAQVQVDEAYWAFTAEPNGPLSHLRRARLSIPYPWVHGEAHVIRLVTSTGTTFDHEIPVAIATPQPGGRFLAIFTLIGIYVGVIPIAIGLLWFPTIVRLTRTRWDFLLALTIGLLAFLLVDAAAEGIEAASEVPQSYQGVALLAFSALGAYLGLEALREWLVSRRARVARHQPGSVLALLVALGIGLHNFGEGLAIGAAFALGEAALGTLLIVGFTLHNTTEGLAIIAPLARETGARGSRTPIGELIRLGLIAGVPTIGGAWIGGFVYSTLWSVLFLGIGVGAIAQVVVQIVRQMTDGERPVKYLSRKPVLWGLLAGFLIMFTTGALIG